MSIKYFVLIRIIFVLKNLKKFYVSNLFIFGTVSLPQFSVEKSHQISNSR